MKFLPVLILISAILISGCVQGPQGQQAAGAAEQAQQVLTTVISPARDLTGTWAGAASWQDNVGNPACSYKGNIVMNLQQNGNNLAGTWQITVTKVTQHLSVPCVTQEGAILPQANLQGTVSSSAFHFISGEGETAIKFDGTITSGLMESTFESCPGQCSGGTTGSKGSFSATRQ